jgi:hypothetical protein
LFDLDFEVDVSDVVADADGGMGLNFKSCTTFLDPADAKCINK